ncbi:MAG TPA: hypothetical protein VL087_04300 [Nitrospirota bacterium]|nr:hypothetical protein [Nitrospirota bacterium]
MKKISLSSWLIFALLLTTLSACGGGGGGGGGTAQTQQSATAILTLATSGTGTTINGIDVTVLLPAGVTVKSVTAPPQTDIGVVRLSGVAAGGPITPQYAIGVYTPASGGIPGKVKIAVVNVNGFSAGPFCTLTCNIAPGTTPVAGDFSLANFNPVDANGAQIIGLTPGLSLSIQ